MTDLNTEFGSEYDITEWEASRNGTEVPDEEEGTKPIEIAPKVGSGFSSRVRSRMQKQRAKSSPGVRAKPTYSRVSVGSTISRGWQFVAQVVQPINLPVARTLAMQAPVAGAVLESTVKDTFIDRILQPIARAEGKGEAVAALLGPPIIVGALSVRPEAAPILVPALRETLKLWVKVAGPEMEKHAEEQKEYDESYGPMIEAMIKYLLQDIAEPEEPVQPETPVQTAPPMTPPTVRPTKKTSRTVNKAVVRRVSTAS